ncbi:MAG: hypothetical protein GY823_07185 [Flavobacteriaceae bacterium]|nr:hypothetical protein [Flavobacteriaceae bacterium]
MKSFTILEGRGKAHVGKVVTILEVTEEKVLVKMGRTNLEIYLDGKTLEEKLNRASVSWMRANTNRRFADCFDMRKVGADRNRGGIGVYDLVINY